MNGGRWEVRWTRRAQYLATAVGTLFAATVVCAFFLMLPGGGYR